MEAIDTLGPAPGDTVLAIGSGPGVGVEVLAGRLVSGRVIGIDPSQAMLREAARRNARFVRDGTVELHRAPVEKIPINGETCDGAIAVNSAQLWKPFAAGVAEVARFTDVTHWRAQAERGRSVALCARRVDHRSQR